MIARAVIGANFGDEGKGLVTDWLCSKGAGVVVRFNGGAQAGHTVVTPQGERHVFSHFGSGTFLGVPTFLSQFFICNPLLFFRESDKLLLQGYVPKVYAHPQCLVTTFADMIINQRKEEARTKRHGSVGVGIHETIVRSQAPGLKITMADLWNGVNLRPMLEEICGKYAQFRTGKKIDSAGDMIEAFMKGAGKFADAVHPAGMAQCKDPVFEGAQGLLLDQDNKEFFPHVTHSKTGMHNVRILMAQAGIKDCETYYVSRTYLTRHGAGPLPREDRALKYEDDTNVEHGFQGAIRFAPLDMSKLAHRCYEDFGTNGYRLLMTHCDQERSPTLGAAFVSHGPTRAHIK